MLLIKSLLILNFSLERTGTGVERNIDFLCTIYVPPGLKGLRWAENDRISPIYQEKNVDLASFQEHLIPLTHSNSEDNFDAFSHAFVSKLL